MPTFNVAKKRGKAKFKISDKRKAVQKRLLESYSEDFDVRISVMQDLVSLGVQSFAEMIQQEFKQLTGEKHGRNGGNARWGSQNSSIYLRNEKFPVRIPRVRNVRLNAEVPLETHRRMQVPFEDERVMQRLLHGLSTHKYYESSSLAAEAFGISASSLSKRFKKCSAKKLQQLQERSLSDYDFVGIFIDAKRYAKDGIMVGLGVTMTGKKVILGIEQISAERSMAVDQFFDNLIERGLKFEQGILFIVDGSKGIRKAIENRFGAYAVVQRCRWHKRENVVSCLNDADKVIFRRRLQDAYNLTTCKEVESALGKIHRDLESINLSAANSLGSVNK